MKVRAPEDRALKRPQGRPAGARGGRAARWMVVAKAAALGTLVLVVGYRALVLALSADALVIGRIDVQGHHYLSEGEVLSLLDGLRGHSMLTVDLDEWRGRLKASPWVQDAAIRHVLPGRVAVALVERTPFGIARLGEGLFLVDRQGVVIDAYGPNYADLDLPIIAGLAHAGSAGELELGEARATLAARVLDTLAARRSLAERISEVDVSNLHDAVVTLKDDPVVLHLGEELFLERLQSYVELAPVLRERVPAIDYVDMRFGERVFVGPRTARAAAPGRR